MDQGSACKAVSRIQPEETVQTTEVSDSSIEVLPLTTTTKGKTLLADQAGGAEVMETLTPTPMLAGEVMALPPD